MPRVAGPADAAEPSREDMPDVVVCRVLRKGDGKIATGEIDVVANKPTWFEQGETFKCPKETALIHEEKGFVEIEG